MCASCLGRWRIVSSREMVKSTRGIKQREMYLCLAIVLFMQSVCFGQVETLSVIEK